MLITRWQAPVVPTRELALMMIQNEGLDAEEERYEANVKIPEHRHPFDEIRIVLEGEMVFNVAGNQLLLRAGDRLEIPANTKHSHATTATGPSLSICVHRPF